MFALSWFLPALTLNMTHGTIPGWDAFLIALTSPLTRDGQLHPPNFQGLLALMSALTSPLFSASAWIVFRPPRSRLNVVAWFALAAFALNSQWCFLLGSDLRKNLSAGYFLWWFSFLVLAAGLFDLSRHKPGESAAPAYAHA
jgi:hypothetical protein